MRLGRRLGSLLFFPGKKEIGGGAFLTLSAGRKGRREEGGGGLMRLLGVRRKREEI